ncbi:MAG TPA: hypothetical protein VFA12_20255 [Stellaceae bacterium]|nr:hypothetical protein [Stellaceae bacterium]
MRLLIGDTNSTNPLLQDEEIAFDLTQVPTVYGAAAMACSQVAAKFSSLADQSAGQTKIAYSQRAKAYRAMAAEYKNLAAARGGGMPYAGGISISDKAQQTQDSDRVPPNFNIGMTDDFLPVAPVGPETQAEIDEVE